MKSREGTVVDADELIADMVETAREKTEESWVR
jgi:arginyl-tRNA synthetase